MQNFTKSHLETVVTYIETRFPTISVSLKEAVEKVADFLGEEGNFFEEKEVRSDIRNKEQLKLELALRFTALADQDAFNELYTLMKSKADGIAYRNHNSMYQHEEFFSFLYECLESLTWVPALSKNLPLDNILQVQVRGRIVRHYQNIDLGEDGSDKDVEILNKLKKIYDGDVSAIVQMTFAEFKMCCPTRGEKCFNNVIALAQHQYNQSWENLLEQVEDKEDYCQYGISYDPNCNDLRDGIRNTFENAVNYSKSIIAKAEKEKDVSLANEYRKINLGYMIVVDLRLEDKTEEEVTAYYSKYYTKIWGKHSASFFMKKALEDFKKNWKFYTDGDTEVQSYAQYLIEAETAA